MAATYRSQLSRILKDWAAPPERVGLLSSTSLVKMARWPAGAPGSKGGQFAPKNGGGGGLKAPTGWAQPKSPLFGAAQPKSGPVGGGGKQLDMFDPSSFKAPQYGLTKPAGQGGYFSSLYGGEPSKPAPPPKGAKPHPKANDKGGPVTINYPTKPSPKETWTDPNATATFVPGGDAPATLNGVAMKPWAKAPKDIAGWAIVGGQNPKVDADFPFEENPNKSVGAGVIIREPDGRIWLTRPTNSFGGYQNTFPKGTVEDGLSLQASAIKEAYEETGLKVKITGVLGDYERTTSKARYYIAERVGGTPKDMGWESQALRLVPPKAMKQFLNMPVDKTLADDVLFELGLMRKSLFDIQKSMVVKPLYVSRRLLNADEVIRWAKAQGFETTVPADEMHVTIAFSKTPVNWLAMGSDFTPEKLVINEGGPRAMKALGIEGDAAVLLFASDQLQWRWQAMREAGASWDFPDYNPHVTISWKAGEVDLSKVEPYTGRLEFGPEIFKELDLDWKSKVVEKAGEPRKGHHSMTQARWPAGTPLGGQWQKMGVNGMVAPPTIAGGLSGANSAYQKKANALYDHAIHGAKLALIDAAKIIIDKDNANATAGKTGSHVKWHAQLAQYANKLVSDLLAAPKAVASADAITGTLKLSSTVYAGAKPGGSNPGGLVKIPGESGTWLVKGNAQKVAGNVTAAQSDDRAKNEVLASHLITAAGFNAPEMKLIDLGDKYGGGLGVASKMVEGIKGFNPNNADHVAAIQKQFAVHAWLANYDVLGPGFDNTVIWEGKAVNIDPGGAILFRAQGLPKAIFGPKATDWDSMRDTTPQQKKVFGAMTASQLQESAKALAAIDDETIHKLVATYGPGSTNEKIQLAAKLIARRDDILERAGLKTFKMSAGVSVAAEKPPIAPPKIDAQPVANAAAGSVPQMPEYANAAKSFYEGASKEALALHAAGNLDGLQMQFEAMSSGVKVGATANSKKFIEFHSALVSDLQAKKEAQNAAIATGAQAVTDAKGQEWKADDGVLNPVAPKAGLSRETIAAAMANAGMPALSEIYVQHGAGEWTGASAEMIAAAEKGDIAAIKATATKTAPQVKLKQKLLAAFSSNTPAPTTAIAESKPKLSEREVIALLAQSGLSSGAKNVEMKGVSGLKSAVNQNIADAAMMGNLPALQSIKTNTSKQFSFKAAAIDALNTKALSAQASAAAPAAPAPVAPPPPKPAAPLPNFDAAKIDPSNSNAPSHNAKIEVLSHYAKTGDVKAILALKFGTNTYGKKQAKVANDVLAALGSSHQVVAGQASHSHPALVGGTSQIPGSQPLPPAPNLATPAAPGTPPKITVADLPRKPDMLNWGGKGQAYSSKPWKNAANQAALNAIEEAAVHGGIAAVKALTFDELDPNTGTPTGKKLPMSQHPSTKVISAYMTDVVDAINDKLNPPKPIASFNIKNVASAKEAADHFNGHKLGTVASNLEKDKQFGFWVALGKVENPSLLKPAKVKNFDSSHVNAGQNAYKNYSPTTKKFVQMIQSSSAMNNAFRSGAKEYGGTSLSTLSKAVYADATELEEGLTIHRWQSMPDGMLKQLEKVPEGVVFQATGPMCTSYHPTATSGFGKHKVTIRAAKGAKAIMSYGSGAFSGEKEVSTLPGARFVLLSKTKGGGKNGGWEIELLMLPPESGY